jgi:sialate O-acetylesterase
MRLQLNVTTISKITLILFLFLLITTAEGAVKLPPLIADNMVIQREKEIHLWGSADAGEKVIVHFRKKRYETVADKNGSWSLLLPPSAAGGPFTMTINEITLRNIMIGDVWICSGQSNVDIPIYRVEDLYKQLTDTLRRDKVRLLKVSNNTHIAGTEEELADTHWRILAPENVSDFSALSYFLANDLYEKTGIPQGVIATSWGGTPIQAWIGEKYVKKYPHYYNEMLLTRDNEYVAQVNYAAKVAGRAWNELLYRLDPGVQEKWYAPDYDDRQWQTVNQYDSGEWTRSEHGPLNGSYWFRQEIEVAKVHAGEEALLRVGCLVDADSTYLNGVLVGTTGYQYPPRKYRIPAGLLREGKNLITIRLIGGSNAAFVKDKPYKIVYNNGEEQPLSAHWKFRHGAYMPLQRIQAISLQNIATACYNSMIWPLRHYPVAGVLWYQGESNTGRAEEYEWLLGDLMANWREIWNEPSLPFFIVQLPDFMEPTETPSESGWVRLRESQRRAARKDPNAELIVGLGLGEWNDIHPLRKKELAERASIEIRRKVYGQPVVVTPRLMSGEVRGNQVILTFSDIVKGDADGSVYDFELSADGRIYQNAKAIAKENKVYITCPDIENPVSVRYAWRNTPPRANLKGRNDLPLPTFQWDYSH